jgi:hypothetical protein
VERVLDDRRVERCALIDRSAGARAHTGAVGTVVLTHSVPDLAYEVEFGDGETFALQPNQLEQASR